MLLYMIIYGLELSTGLLELKLFHLKSLMSENRGHKALFEKQFQFVYIFNLYIIYDNNGHKAHDFPRQI